MVECGVGDAGLVVVLEIRSTEVADGALPFPESHDGPAVLLIAQPSLFTVLNVLLRSFTVPEESVIVGALATSCQKRQGELPQLLPLTLVGQVFIHLFVDQLHDLLVVGCSLRQARASMTCSVLFHRDLFLV